MSRVARRGATATIRPDEAEFAPIRRLSALAPLSTREVNFLIELMRRRQQISARTELITEGVAIPAPMLLIDGWAIRYRLLADGRRQIIDLCLPGELIGPCWPVTPAAPSSVMALTPVIVADAAPLRNLVRVAPEDCSNLALALEYCAGLTETSLLNHVVRLGRQTAYERTAHLFLEIRDRLALSGCGNGESFPLPLTQETLADMLGLTSVHINRTLQQLRRERMITMSENMVTLLEPAALQAIADYHSPIDLQALRI